MQNIIEIEQHLLFLSFFYACQNVASDHLHSQSKFYRNWARTVAVLYVNIPFWVSESTQPFIERFIKARVYALQARAGR